jgi:hypothetical protein
MGKTLENVVITINDENYPAQKLIELWLREDTHINYNKLEQVKAILIELNINVPEELSSRLETSDHKKRKKGEKKDNWKKDIRDLGIYLEKQSTSIPHGKSEQFIAEKADELGLEDEKYLAERIRAIGKFFEQDLSRNTIYLDYNLYLREAWKKKHVGREAERYALRLVAQKYNTSQAKIRKLLK